jgi:hypothetical protein
LVAPFHLTYLHQPPLNDQACRPPYSIVLFVIGAKDMKYGVFLGRFVLTWLFSFMFLLVLVTIHAQSSSPDGGPTFRHFGFQFSDFNTAVALSWRDWYEQKDGGWIEVSSRGVEGRFRVIAKGVTQEISVDGLQTPVQGRLVENEDLTLILFIPESLASSQWLMQRKPKSGFPDAWTPLGLIQVADRVPSRVVADAESKPAALIETRAQIEARKDEWAAAWAKQQAATAQERQTALAKAAAAQAQAAAAQVQDQEQDTRGDMQNRISELRSDIDEQERSAQNNENSANQVLNNCSGPGAAICQALGEAGAARFRQKAAQARNQADSDREEIQRLEGQEVQASQRRDTSYGGSLQQVTTETGTSIQSAAAQQQASLQAIAAANQQRQQAQAQQPAPSTSVAAARSSSVHTATAVAATTGTSGSLTSSSGSNPYSSALAQGSYNPYTGTGSGSAQGSCTDMTGSVQGTVKIGSDGWVSGYLTNNSNQTLYVSYTFKQNGVPSTAMANAGGTTIQGGQTVGGEGQGLYSTGADKNPPEIYWYAVLKQEHDKYGCVHKW